jgi:hypothetical protein
MSEYQVTTTAKTIAHKSSHPIFGEQTTTIEIDDEAAGPFVKLIQQKDDGIQTVSLDMEELTMICREARKMIKAVERSIAAHEAFEAGK